MKKGKAIEDNQLDNVQGGYVLKMGRGSHERFVVVDQSGHFLSRCFSNVEWAQHIAREQGESDQVITEEEYKKMFGPNR